MKGCDLPIGSCVKCGAPANGQPLKRKYSWHSPGIYVIVLFNVIIYAIVAMIVRKSITLNVPLCDAHAKRRKRMILIAWLIFLGGIVLAVVLFQQKLEPGGLAAFVLGMIIALIVGMVGSKIMTPTKIDEKSGWFTGVCPEYLNSLQSR